VTRTTSRTDDAPAPLGAYSQAVRAGGFVFVSGTVGIDPTTAGFMHHTTAGQTEQAITNIEAVLRSYGGTLADVVKVTAYLADVRSFGEFDAVYALRMPQPYPARATVGSDLSHVPGLLVELDAVAHLAVGARMTDEIQVLRYAAFAETEDGGNPAGVVLTSESLSESVMQAVAADVGYSETAFAREVGSRRYEVRYFTPVDEVPFCGHATIATAVALAEHEGGGPLLLDTHAGAVHVDVVHDDTGWQATLTTVAVSVSGTPEGAVEEMLAALDWRPEDLDPAYPPSVASAGARHLVLVCTSRERLADLDYDIAAARRIMADHGWVTVMLAWPESSSVHHARNVFPVGDIVEDPATGAAAAAYTAYLGSLDRLAPDGRLTILQGHDMGRPSRIETTLLPGDDRVRVRGRARALADVATTQGAAGWTR